MDTKGQAVTDAEGGSPVNWPAKLLVAAGFLAIVVFAVTIYVNEPAVTTGVKTSSPAAGGRIARQPAGPVLGSLVSAQYPPPDILNALPFPAGAQVLQRINIDHNAGTYDRTVVLRTSLSPAQTVAFYLDDLKSAGWVVSYDGGAAHHDATEVLAEKASNDTYFWEVGVDVFPRSSQSSSTRFQLNLSIVQSG